MNVNNRIKVLLVDNHTLMREGVDAMLKQVDDFEIVGSLSSGEDALNSFRALNPDVIIMDIIMSGITGIEATRWIKERDANVKVILLSREINKGFLTAGIQSGIDGYLTKEVAKETLVKAIRQVHTGVKFFNDVSAKLIFDDFYQREKTKLTKREQELLPLVASGKTNQEVATKLLISIKTVETHKGNLLHKLGLKNTAELVKYAIKNGLITI